MLTALLGYQLINFFKDKNILNFYSLCFIVLFLSILGTKTSFMALASLLIFFSVYELVKTYFEKSIKDYYFSKKCRRIVYDTNNKRS